MVSFQAWKKYFPEPEYEYRFWTDEAIDQAFREGCPEQYDRFSAYAKEIYRADLSRYCILKTIGGIYSDLDYEPRSNFYTDLQPGKISLIESPYANEEFQNSLMASPNGTTFSKYWSDLLDTFERQSNTSKSSYFWSASNPTDTTGPKLLDSFTQSLSSEFSIVTNKLPCRDFQHKVHKDDGPIKEECDYLVPQDSVKGIHWGTVSWLESGLLSTELKGTVNDAETLRLFRQLHPELGVLT